jgi:hypothetical protein
MRFYLWNEQVPNSDYLQPLQSSSGITAKEAKNLPGPTMGTMGPYVIRQTKDLPHLIAALPSSHPIIFVVALYFAYILLCLAPENSRWDRGREIVTPLESLDYSIAPRSFQNILTINSLTE